MEHKDERIINGNDPIVDKQVSSRQRSLSQEQLEARRQSRAANLAARYASRAQRPPAPTDWLDPREIEIQYNIPVSTQAVWRSCDRYGWGSLHTRFGRSVRAQRARIEQWIAKREAS